MADALQLTNANVILVTQLWIAQFAWDQIVSHRVAKLLDAQEMEYANLMEPVFATWITRVLPVQYQIAARYTYKSFCLICNLIMEALALGRIFN